MQEEHGRENMKTKEMKLIDRYGRGRNTYSKVFLRDSQWVEDLCIDGFIFKINQVHLLSDLLEGSLGAEGCEIWTHVSVGLRRHLQQHN